MNDKSEHVVIAVSHKPEAVHLLRLNRQEVARDTADWLRAIGFQVRIDHDPPKVGQ